MNGFEGLRGYVQNLQDVGTRYFNYERRNTSEMDFREPANEFEKKIAGRIKTKTNLLAIVMIVAFVFTLVSTIMSDVGIGVILLVALMSVIVIGISIFVLTQKTQVRTAIAIHKDFDRISDSNSKTYHITVIPDDGQQVMYLRIGVSKKDYEMITEGTPVLVVKVATGAKATVIR